MKKIVYIGNQLQNQNNTPTTIDTLSVNLKKEGFLIETYSKKKNYFLRLVDMIYGVLKNKKATVVLIDTYSTFAFWYFVTIAFLCIILKVKFIPYLHGGNLPARLDANSKLCKWLFSKSYSIISPSGYLIDEFEKRGYANLRLIPNTIEIKNYPFLECHPTFPKILWVRSFAQLYNPNLAIDVLVELQKKYPLAELCMVGPDKDGSLMQTKQYAANKGVNVVFTGKISKKEWVKLAADYNLFLNTTNFDNTPVSVIEAMALGLPVISTNVGGLPFLIQNGKNGILVPPNNCLALADAIVNITQNQILYKTIQINARKTAEQWDWSQVKQKWSSLFNSIN